MVRTTTATATTATAATYPPLLLAILSCGQ